MATLDLLGEAVLDVQRAEAAASEYCRMLDEIAAAKLPSNVSVKLTSLGLSLSDELCRQLLERVVSHAASHGNFVRIDMEDSSTTEATLRLHQAVYARYSNVGVVLQAYLRRSLSDADRLPPGTTVRLCKGIYLEPRRVAYSSFDTIRANFLYLLEKLLRAGRYVAIATHDDYLICGALALLDRYAVPRDGYEFQMLLGVEPELRSVLLSEGHRLRVYVPYGSDWYAYSLRRLRENPMIARHILRALLGLPART
jgi:proline dehydrogenase